MNLWIPENGHTGSDADLRSVSIKIAPSFHPASPLQILLLTNYTLTPLMKTAQKLHSTHHLHHPGIIAAIVAAVNHTSCSLSSDCRLSVCGCVQSGGCWAQSSWAPFEGSDSPSVIGCFDARLPSANRATLLHGQLSRLLTAASH